jgi:hypothetical protein
MKRTKTNRIAFIQPILAQIWRSPDLILKQQTGNVLIAQSSLFHLPPYLLPNPTVVVAELSINNSINLLRVILIGESGIASGEGRIHFTRDLTKMIRVNERSE